jgi:hypothetical protein
MRAEQWLTPDRVVRARSAHPDVRSRRGTEG